MTRRQLAQLTVAGALPGAERKYAGPLDGFEDKVQTAAFDPVGYTLQAAAKAPLRLTFRARSRAEAEAWQGRLRPKVVELLGGFPAERAALRAETLEVREFPAYRREKFVFESRSGFAVLGYLLTPLKGRAPFPAVVCVPGHGRGVDDIVGIDDKGRDRTDRDGYQHDFAIQAVEHGLAAVAIEPIGFGCRRDQRTRKKALSTSACQPVAGTLLLMGQTMIGWRVWDVMRTLDWIATRKDLDAKRVGCMGISGGGTCTTFSAAIEPRIRAAFVSGYLNTFRDSIMAMSHCIDNYVPGILEWAELYDVAGLIAPRPLFAESGERDPIFPIAASRAAFNRVKKIYELYGAAALAEQETFDDKHAFCGKRGLPFLAKHLGA